MGRLSTRRLMSALVLSSVGSIVVAGVASAAPTLASEGENAVYVGDSIDVSRADPDAPAAGEDWDIEACRELIARVTQGPRWSSGEMDGYCESSFHAQPANYEPAAVESYAHDYGISLADAQARLTSSPLIGAVAGQLRLAGGDRVAHVSIASPPAEGLVIELTDGPALPLVEKIARESGIPYRLTYDAANSVYHLTDLASDLTTYLSAKFAEIRRVAVDEASGALVVEYADTAPGPSAILAEAQSFVGVGVNVVLEPGPGPIAANRGNRLITGCTSGFNVKSSNGSVGMTTAGHCGNGSMKWRWFSDQNTTFPMYYTGSYSLDEESDVQYRTTSEQVFPAFYGFATTAGSELSVTQRMYRADMMGSYVCKRSATSGWSCATVNSISDPWSGVVANDKTGTKSCSNTDCAYVWITADGPSALCDGGDSGSAIYRGADTAMSILSACAGTKSVSMAIGYVYKIDKSLYCVGTCVRVY